MKQLALLLLAGLLGATGCTVGPEFKTPVTALPEHFNAASTAEFNQQQIEIHWWRLFQDAQLSTLVEQTLTHNHELAAATANLQAARALYQEAGLSFAPTVTSHANYTDQLRSVGALNNRAFVPRDLSLYNIGFDASWELDLFGRVRRNVEASNAAVQMSVASRDALRVSLIAEVARNYFELRGLQKQQQVIAQNISNQEQILQVVQAKLAYGRGTALDRARMQAQLAATRALLPSLSSARSQAVHRLSVLCGQLPATLSAQLEPVAAIPKAPLSIKLGNPADLLRRRPDIRMVEQNLAASTARIGVATADLFPRVTFVGTLSLEGSSFASLGATGSDSYSLGPRISWAAMDLQRVHARIDAANAHASADLAQYQQAVLNALEETENTLANYVQTTQKLQLLAEAVKADAEAQHLASTQYQAGAIDFLTLLDTQQRWLNDQNQLAQAETAKATALVALYKALGGGWEG